MNYILGIQDIHRTSAVSELKSKYAWLSILKRHLYCHRYFSYISAKRKNEFKTIQAHRSARIGSNATRSHSVWYPRDAPWMSHHFLKWTSIVFSTSDIVQLTVQCLSREQWIYTLSEISKTEVDFILVETSLKTILAPPLTSCAIH